MEFMTPDPSLYGQIEALYTEAFPADERVPFSLLTKERCFELSALVEGDRVCAIAVAVVGGEAVLLDYLAVHPQQRSSGLGGKMLSALKDRYAASDGLFIEIERLGAGRDDAENETRAARRRFYLKNGFVDTDINTLLFGVKMSLMYLPLRKPLLGPVFEAYRGCFAQAEKHFIRRRIRLDS